MRFKSLILLLQSMIWGRSRQISEACWRVKRLLERLSIHDTTFEGHETHNQRLGPHVEVVEDGGD